MSRVASKKITLKRIKTNTTHFTRDNSSSYNYAKNNISSTYKAVTQLTNSKMQTE